MVGELNLGGNIVLKGFRDVGTAELIVVKKVIGNHARKISTKQEFDNLELHLKEIHATDDHSGKYDLKAHVDFAGNKVNAEVVEHNLYVGLDSIMKKVAAQIR